MSDDLDALIARAREMRMDAEVGTFVERIRILGELANALQSVRAELAAANTRIDTAKAALEISEPVHHAMLCGASRGPNDSCFHPACSCACHGPVRVPVQWLAARRALGGDC